MGEDVFFYLGSLTLGVESPTENMNFLYNDPSENRMEFTKLKVACKYASIERGYVYNWLSARCGILLYKKNNFNLIKIRLSNCSEREATAFAL